MAGCSWCLRPWLRTNESYIFRIVEEGIKVGFLDGAMGLNRSLTVA